MLHLSHEQWQRYCATGSFKPSWQRPRTTTLASGDQWLIATDGSMAIMSLCTPIGYGELMPGERKLIEPYLPRTGELLQDDVSAERFKIWCGPARWEIPCEECRGSGIESSRVFCEECSSTGMQRASHERYTYLYGRLFDLDRVAQLAEVFPSDSEFQVRVIRTKHVSTVDVLAFDGDGWRAVICGADTSKSTGKSRFGNNWPDDSRWFNNLATIRSIDAKLDENPDDGYARLVLADVYEEAGEDDYAAFLRWMVDGFRCSPQKPDAGSAAGKYWRWYSPASVYHSVPPSVNLVIVPQQLFASLADGVILKPGRCRGYTTRLLAEEALYRAWRQNR